MKRHRLAALTAAIAALVLPMVVPIEGLSAGGSRVLGIFLMAIVLWVTEAIPLYATAAMVIFLQVALASNQAVIPLPAEEAAPSYEVFFQTLAHPVLMLFLGGFFLAAGAAAFSLDRSLARILLRPFGTSPPAVLLGIMAVTAFFSMFMSNTATTATMLAVVLPMLASIEPGDRLRPALALAVPLAANIGGIATPVGTPPNAIAVGSLADAGITVSFGRWMAMALPFAALLLVASWAVLVRRFRSRAETLEVRLTAPFDRSRPALIFYATFAATVALWLTEPLHGIPSAIVGFFPVVVLLGTGVFDHTHLQRIPWHVLWLVAGGIALGIGVAATGVDDWIVTRFDWSAPPALLVVAGLALLALLLSTVISNTAAANLLIPIGLALAASDAVSIDPITVGFFIAVGASLAMALPISTPPNALAYSTGSVRTGDMAVVGGLVGIIGLALLLFGTPLLWAAAGVAP